MKNHKKLNANFFVFYFAVIVLFVSTWFLLDQYSIKQYKLPQIFYLITIVGLLFLYGIIFLFMLFQYLCRKDLTYLIVIGIASLSCNIYISETIYIISSLIENNVLLEKRTNDVAIFYYFRQLNFIILLCLSIKAYSKNPVIIETKERKPCYILLSIAITIILGVIAHNFSSYNPKLELYITTFKEDNITIKWQISYIYSLILLWSLTLIYLTIKTKLHNALWLSIALTCCTAILTNILLLGLEEYSLYLWYISRGLETICMLCIISILMYNTFLILKKETDSAIHDAMTNIYNRKVFYKFLSSFIKNDSVCVVIIDIDKFKRINDNYGHQEGDKTIISIVEIIKESIRDSDILARVGGEEFGLILRRKNESEAIKVAERIRACVELNTSIPGFYKLKEPMTISMGLYYAESNTVSVDKIISFADAALYQAKNTGRNKVVCYST